VADEKDAPFKIVRPTRDNAMKSRIGLPESELPPVDQETNWDKPGPTGPPEEAIAAELPHLVPLINFFNEAIFPDSILIDICMKRSMEIVRKNVSMMSSGIDNEPIAGSNPTHPAHLAGIASGICIELYKQTVEQVKANPKDYQAAMDKAKEILGATQKTSKIITP
jgi:hypothetical protein